jgi:hypothetical protein
MFLIVGLTFACSESEDPVPEEPRAGAGGAGGSASTTGGSAGKGGSTGGTQSPGSGGSSSPTAGSSSGDSGSSGVSGSGGMLPTAGMGGSSARGGSSGSANGGKGGAFVGRGGTTSMTGGKPGPLMGPSNVWEDVTPPGLDLVTEFGAQDVLAEPNNMGVFYGFVCRQGVFRSMDWGATWGLVSTDGIMEQGRPWGEAISPDGSYMLASSGYGLNEGAWKSTDAGATWRSHSIGGDNDPYNFDIDPANPMHVLVAMHARDDIFESMDGGETWEDRGSAGTGGSNYVFFITSTTWISIGQDGSGAGTRRTTNSGASWERVGPMEHAHGNAQIFIDPDTNAIYVPSHLGGVYRSTDGAASFEQVADRRSSVVFATDRYIYAMDPGANQAGTDPVAQRALRDDGTNWEPMETPPAMNNGAKRAATMFDPMTEKWVIVSGNWNAGFWRYIEEE